MASWGTCLSECNGASNNIHFNSPPLMSDGRNFSSWNPACQINENLREKYGIKTNQQYRQFLMENADKIIKQNRVAACNQCGACERQFVQPTQQQETNEKQKPLTYLYDTCREKSMPYGYEDSDLKSVYLSRQELQAQYNAPIMSQDEYLHYFRR